MSLSANGHPRELLSDYLDDELDIEERTVIDRHLAGCEDCRSHLDALRRLARAVADEKAPPVPPDLQEKIGRRLDAVTVVRPRRWRFAVPVGVAATLSALGILIAIQWREGRLTPPASPELQRQAPLYEDKKAADAVAPLPATPSDERESARAKEKDSKMQVRPEAEPPKPNQTVVGGVPGGVVGGVEGGVEGGVAGGRGNAEENRAADAGRRDQPLEKSLSAQGRLMSSAPAAAPAAKAEAVAVSSCADRWSDSGVRGMWQAEDPVATARELNDIAHRAGGMGLWRGVDDGRPYLLIVPRNRYAEVFDELRGRGVADLVELPALAPGDDCAAMSITIVPAR